MAVRLFNDAEPVRLSAKRDANVNTTSLYEVSTLWVV